MFWNVVNVIAESQWHRVTEDCWSKMMLVAAFGVAFWMNRPKATVAQ